MNLNIHDWILTPTLQLHMQNSTKQLHNYSNYWLYLQVITRGGVLTICSALSLLQGRLTVFSEVLV